MLVYCRCIGFYNVAALVCHQSNYFTRCSASCPVFWSLAAQAVVWRQPVKYALVNGVCQI